MDVVAPLLADGEPAKLGQPRQCPLHYPPVAAQLLRTFHLLSRYTPLDATLLQRTCTFLVIVGFVGVKLLGTLPRSASSGTLDGPDGVQKLLEDHRAVDIGRREHHRERDAPPVDHKVALRARFPLIRRIRSGLWPPLWPG